MGKDKISNARMQIHHRRQQYSGRYSGFGSPDIIIKGHVADLGEIFSSCKLSVAPLRFGAGSREK